MAYHTERLDCLAPVELATLRSRIHQSRHLAPNNLTGDFVGARGFSVVFRLDTLPQVLARFAWLAPYLAAILTPETNAFYLNPLLLQAGSRVDPHVDRSLRAYCRTVEPPRWVSVLYVTLPDPLVGGELVLQQGKREVARIVPHVNKAVRFQGDLTHFVTPLAADTRGERLSVVCEQYDLPPDELARVPELGLESGGKRY